MKSRNKSAQGAVEFVIVLGAILFFFVIFFAVIQDNQNEKNKDKERIVVQNVALDVQDEINLAAGTSDGYSREFKTPLNILGKDYNIEIIHNLVYVSTENHGFSYKIPEITGAIQKGNNIIKKENGTVYLN